MKEHTVAKGCIGFSAKQKKIRAEPVEASSVKPVLSVFHFNCIFTTCSLTRSSTLK
jgi:hypothetical protein